MDNSPLSDNRTLKQTSLVQLFFGRPTFLEPFDLSSSSCMAISSILLRCSKQLFNTSVFYNMLVIPVINKVLNIYKYMLFKLMVI